jgi:uncharacterized protein YodC (DUF2158 family)
MIVGDIVRLKSGGPEMTLALQIAPGTDYKVFWFDGATKYEAEFPMDTLEFITMQTPFTDLKGEVTRMISKGVVGNTYEMFQKLVNNMKDIWDNETGQ